MDLREFLRRYTIGPYLLEIILVAIGLSLIVYYFVVD